MTFSSVHLVTFVILVSMSTLILTLACDIETARQSTSGALPGGWSGVAVNDDKVLQLKQSVVNDALVNKAHHVIESYQQVVAGVNYCIRFSASANCSTHHCQTVECVAGGHQPVTSGAQQQPVQRTSLSCTTVTSCDIEATRELARVTPMPGGWQAEDTSSEIITQLYNRAVRIAAVRRGVVRDAFYQVVAGFNYCIQFDSTGSANCHQQCQALSCVAAGFLPLPFRTNNPGVVTKIGVKCQPGGQLLGYTGNTTGTSSDVGVTERPSRSSTSDTGNGSDVRVTNIPVTGPTSTGTFSDVGATAVTESFAETVTSHAIASLMTACVAFTLVRVLGLP